MITDNPHPINGPFQERQSSYFTFGSHMPLHGYYLVVQAFTAQGAMELVLEQFGTCWAQQFSQQVWDASFVNKGHNLQPLTKEPLKATVEHERKGRIRRDLQSGTRQKAQELFYPNDL